jgi:hypothetical protein
MGVLGLCKASVTHVNMTAMDAMDDDTMGVVYRYGVGGDEEREVLVEAGRRVVREAIDVDGWRDIKVPIVHLDSGGGGRGREYVYDRVVPLIEWECSRMEVLDWGAPVSVEEEYRVEELEEFASTEMRSAFDIIPLVSLFLCSLQ